MIKCTRTERGKTKKTCVLLVELSVLAFVFTQMAPAQSTWYVATNGTGNGSSWALATNNIQDAISLAGTGDLILVSNGVYQTGGVTNWPSGTLLTNRVAITNAITVRSANNDPTNTIIKGAWDPATNGPAAVRCVYMVSGSSLIGFTVTNGATLGAPFASANKGQYGGGVFCLGGSIVSNCVIAGNSAQARGAGAYLEGGKLYNCTLNGNTAIGLHSSGGGGAAGHDHVYGYLYNCTLSSNRTTIGYGGGALRIHLYNCTLSGNQASYGGCTCSSSLTNCTLSGNQASVGVAYGSTLNNCTLSSNQAYYGGGGYNSTLNNCTLSGNQATSTGGGADDSTLNNCTLSGNQAANGGGAADSILNNCTLSGNQATANGGGVHGGNLNNCIVYFNNATLGLNWHDVAAANFTNSCTTPAQIDWASGNITNDPMFVDKGSNYGAAHVVGNYRLAANSPCVNAGTNQDWMTGAVDLDGRMRIRYGTVDMGAYERIHSGTICGFY